MKNPMHFLSVADWSAEALLALHDRACELKELFRRGERPQTLRGRTLAMYFEKPSLRTRVTFEAGVTQLGGHAIVLGPEQVGIGTRESARDVARNLSRWVDGVMARTFSHELLEELAREASIPVINGLTDRLHPCQAMADLQTIAERMDPREAVVAYVGDGNNVVHSLALLAGVLGMQLRIGTPESHRPDVAVMEQVKALSKASGAKVTMTDDPFEAVRDAHFVYTDTWTSMGQEAEAAERRKIFAPYQVNDALLEAAPAAFVMHCLPAHRGEEITDAVLDGDRAIVYDQAENRLHAQKAILERTLLTGRP